MSALAFFPWLRISEPIDVGPIHLVPYERGGSPGGSVQAIIDTVTEPYVFSKRSPISRATLFRYADHGLLDDLAHDEIEDAFELAGLVTMSGLAARKFFAWKYWNREDFQFTIQMFDRPDRGAFFQTRRLDGSHSTYIPFENLIVARPVHVSGTNEVDIDVKLLAALLLMREEEDWLRFRESIQTFNLASTDSVDVPIETAVVLINGAFERALDVEAKEPELAERFTNVISPMKDLSLSDCGRFSDPEVRRRFARSDVVRDAWIRDLFRLRGHLAHGRTTVRYPSVWSVREHLLLAGFVFPLLLKQTLASRGVYTLSNEDRDGIDAFEALCCIDHFSVEGHSPSDFPWHRILRTAGLDRIVEKWLSKCDEISREGDDPSNGTDGA